MKVHTEYTVYTYVVNKLSRILMCTSNWSNITKVLLLLSAASLILLAHMCSLARLCGKQPSSGQVRVFGHLSGNNALPTPYSSGVVGWGVMRVVMGGPKVMMVYASVMQNHICGHTYI